MKFAGRFKSVLGCRHSEFIKDFYEARDVETEKAFEERWTSLVARYELQSNERIKALYDLRRMWALPFLRGFFFVICVLSVMNIFEIPENYPGVLREKTDRVVSAGGENDERFELALRKLDDGGDVGGGGGRWVWHQGARAGGPGGGDNDRGRGGVGGRRGAGRDVGGGQGFGRGRGAPHHHNG